MTSPYPPSAALRRPARVLGASTRRDRGATGSGCSASARPRPKSEAQVRSSEGTKRWATLRVLSATLQARDALRTREEPEKSARRVTPGAPVTGPEVMGCVPPRLWPRQRQKTAGAQRRAAPELARRSREWPEARIGARALRRQAAPDRRRVRRALTAPALGKTPVGGSSRGATEQETHRPGGVATERNQHRACSHRGFFRAD